ncbi:hypothetical protein [Aquimarina muelleri]|uniref:DUF4468 domain-containing protein n=1 Tax=Aquimarina muelleri TaxID=279356 RepID=A0A918JTZ8_9FLAO|nr:hypothetical protein [Aquimarina muelleri]MCX2761459.1 hypothetical protein [Aquimarina muelleri]GGX13869.1 hypothetical protein GCM10007384_14320 [Aquimarina muelleri]
MRKILLFLCLALSSTIFAQLPRDLLNTIKKDYTFEDYSGNIYMTSGYKDANVIHEKSTTFDAKLRYNIHTDALEYDSGSQLYELVKKPTIHARIDGDYFYYCTFESQRGVDRSGYYILVELSNGYSIYKRLTLKIREPRNGVGVGAPIESGAVRSSTTYYLEEAGVIMELPMSKKDMLAVFNDKENELKEYLKKEKIRLRKEEDLVRLVARYNALKSSGSASSQSLLSNRVDRN